MTVGMWLKCSDELIWTSKIKNNLLKEILKKKKEYMQNIRGKNM